MGIKEERTSMTSFPLTGLDQNYRSARRFFMSLSFLRGNSKLWLTRHRGETKGDIGWHEFCEALAHLPSWHPPPGDQGHLGNNVSRMGTMLDWLWSLGLCFTSGLPSHDFCRTFREEISWRNFTQVQNGPVSRGLVPKNKETAIFYLTLTRMKNYLNVP